MCLCCNWRKARTNTSSKVWRRYGTQFPGTGPTVGKKEGADRQTDGTDDDDEEEEEQGPCVKSLIFLVYRFCCYLDVCTLPLPLVFYCSSVNGGSSCLDHFLLVCQSLSSSSSFSSCCTAQDETNKFKRIGGGGGEGRKIYIKWLADGFPMLSMQLDTRRHPSVDHHDSLPPLKSKALFFFTGTADLTQKIKVAFSYFWFRIATGLMTNDHCLSIWLQFSISCCLLPKDQQQQQAIFVQQWVSISPACSTSKKRLECIHTPVTNWTWICYPRLVNRGKWNASWK